MTTNSPELLNKATIDTGACADVGTTKTDDQVAYADVGTSNLATIQVAGVELTVTGLIVHNNNLTPADANRIFAAVLSMHKSCNWLLGDTLALMDREWGNQYTGSKYEEAAQATGYSLNTLRRMALVCKAYPIEKRHANLSFSHHVEASYIVGDLSTRETMLNTASENKQSIRDFRKTVREHNAKPKLDDNGKPLPEHIAHPELGENTDRPFGLIDLPERAAPGAPPMWDAMKFSDWVDKQEPETYTAEQCAQAIELSENIADYYERVKARLEELQNSENTV